MRSAGFGAAVALLVLFAIASDAYAQAPGYSNTGGTIQFGPAPTPSAPPASVGGGANPVTSPRRSSTPPPAPGGGKLIPPEKGGPKIIHEPAGKLRRSCKTTVRHGVRTRTCRYRRGGKLVRKCTTRRGKRTCRFYKHGVAQKVCVKRRGKKARCRSLLKGAASATGGPAVSAPLAKAAAKYSSGVNNPLNPSVVRFYLNGRGWCSGTMVLNGVVLTAAHCLFANVHDGRGSYGYYDINKMLVVPGNTWTASGNVGKWGVYRVANAFVPNAWKNEDGGQDWGLVVLQPDSTGRHAGQYTGLYGLTWNAQFPVGTRIIRSGYPASYSFNTAAWGYGGYQWYCDMRWDGETNNNFPYTWSSYNIATGLCEMNGGSSGGPVWALLPNGSWTIVGVNNRGYDGANGFGTWGISSYFDNRFGAFWNGVMSQIS